MVRSTVLVTCSLTSESNNTEFLIDYPSIEIAPPILNDLERWSIAESKNSKNYPGFTLSSIKANQLF